MLWALFPSPPSLGTPTRFRDPGQRGSLPACKRGLRGGEASARADGRHGVCSGNRDVPKLHLCACSGACKLREFAKIVYSLNTHVCECVRAHVFALSVINSYCSKLELWCLCKGKWSKVTLSPLSSRKCRKMKSVQPFLCQEIVLGCLHSPSAQKAHAFNDLSYSSK